MSYDDIKLHRKQQSIRRKFEAKELLIRLKSLPCTDCGGVFHHCQMDFFRADTQAPLISRILIKSQNTIISETKKCILLCSNCCRLRTYKMQRLKRADEY